MALLSSIRNILLFVSFNYHIHTLISWLKVLLDKKFIKLLEIHKIKLNSKSKRPLQILEIINIRDLIISICIIDLLNYDFRKEVNQIWWINYFWKTKKIYLVIYKYWNCSALRIKSVLIIRNLRIVWCLKSFYTFENQMDILCFWCFYWQ